MELTNLKRFKNGKLPRYELGSPFSLMQANGLLTSEYGKYAKENIAQPIDTGNIDTIFGSNKLSDAIEKQDPKLMQASYNKYTSTSQGGAKLPEAMNMNPYTAAIKFVFDTATDAIAASNYTKDEILNNAQRGTGNIGGFGYLTVNVDGGAIRRGYAAEDAKSIGGIIGGLFKEKSRNLHIRDAIRVGNSTTEFNRNGALSQYIRTKNYKATGNPNSMQLFANGKNAFAGTNTGYMYDTPFVVSPAGTALDVNISKPNFSEGTGRYIPIATPYGTMIGKLEDINAYVSPGEQLVSGDGMSSYTVPGKQNNDDKIPARLAEGSDGTARTGNSIVLSNKNGAAKYYRATGDLMGALMLNPATKKQSGKLMAKNGKSCLPKYTPGTPYKDDARFSAWTSILPNAFGMLTSAGQLIGDALTPVNSYDTMALSKNIYERPALEELSKLKINSLPIMNAQKSAEARGYNAINRAGGLGTGQRALARIAMTNQTQRNIADALMNIQMQNNSYFSDYAKTALQSGAANAQRAIAANQFDIQMRDRANAAKRSLINTDQYNSLGYLQNMYKQDSTRRLHNWTMDRYDQQLTLDQLKTLADIQNMTALGGKNLKFFSELENDPEYKALLKKYGLG